MKTTVCPVQLVSRLPEDRKIKQVENYRKCRKMGLFYVYEKVSEG